jgi:hypothetical protein
LNRQDAKDAKKNAKLNTEEQKKVLMKRTVNWEWFRSAVADLLEPVLNRYGLYHLIGHAYELEENQDTHDVLKYVRSGHDKLTLCVDILEWSYPGKIDKTFYWFRIIDYASFTQLNRRYSTDEALDIFRGWIVLEQRELEPALQEAAEVLEEYLSTNTAGGASPSPCILAIG